MEFGPATRGGSKHQHSKCMPGVASHGGGMSVTVRVAVMQASAACLWEVRRSRGFGSNLAVGTPKARDQQIPRRNAAESA